MDKHDMVARNISDAEIEILQQLWQQSPLTAQEIIEKMAAVNGSHPRTIKTLINRLLNKGALGFEERNRKYHYFPLLRKQDFYKLKTRTFLDKFFDGRISPMVSFFANHKKLSNTEIAELKQLVEKLEADDDK